MAQQLVDSRDQAFVIWEQLHSEELLRHPRFKTFNRKTCELILQEARSLAIKELLPTMKEGDEIGVQYENNKVMVPECYHKAFSILREGDWPSLAIDPAIGGQGAPSFLGMAASEYFMAANWSLVCYSTMGIGTAMLIGKYGTAEDKTKYLDKLVTAQWGGTMLLTEPGAGSDVGALTTSAVLNADGTYCLSGNKIFITNGEHDLVENIIHPVLARVEGDPPGTRGLSLFIVPKFFVGADGKIGKRNDIACTGVEEKHGLHGSATTSMTLGAKGECIGYLLGKRCEGMKIMFTMINYARMKTGLQGLAYASASYMHAVNYARERLQGRDLVNFADPAAPSVAIIKHPDVRRNLLWMKSYVCGMRSFFQYMALCHNNAEVANSDEERARSADLFNLLSPVIKEYLASKSYEVCVQSIQVFGGAGYTRDYPVEQYARDCRAASIYEGTSGIQAMDFLGRKINAKSGAAFGTLIAEINKTTARAMVLAPLEALALKVQIAAKRLSESCIFLRKMAASAEIRVAFAHSLPFLHATGDVIMAWMLLWRAAVAMEKIESAVSGKEKSFYGGQIAMAEFYIETELEIAMGKLNAIQSGCKAAITIDDEGFGGL